MKGTITKSTDSQLTIIYAKWIATVASDSIEPSPEDIITDGALVIEGSKIAAVGPANDIQKLFNGMETHMNVVTLPDNHILIPGLINCHTHAAMSFLRGYADDMDLTTWLTKYIWPTEQTIMSDDYVYNGSLIAFYEAIKSGTTMLNDSYFLPEQTIKAAKEIGIRCVLAQPLLDFGKNDLDQQLETAENFIQTLQKKTRHKTANDDHLIRVSFNPHAAYTVPYKWLKKGCEMMQRVNKEYIECPIILHTHLHETDSEYMTFEHKHGKTALQVFDECGGVNRHFVAAHCVSMSNSDIELMAERKANVCHCIKSNLKLASGFPSIHKMLKAGVNVCLGTDGGCSNNSVDMLSEMRTAALVNKAQSKDPTALNAYTVLRMATRNGSRAMGRLSELGSLEVGKLADVVAVDLAGEDNIGLPIFDPISHLIYTTHVQVTNVWIHGKVIMKDKEIITTKLKPETYKNLLTKLQKLRNELKLADK